MQDTAVFEAHATGTSVGDPIEASAIGETFAEFHSQEDKLIVGTLKPNLGHLESTSGLASLVKTVLTMERGLIPPNGNFEKLNPNVEAERYHLHFPISLTEWPRGKPRRTSINSFGFGGANAHVVLEEFGSYLRPRKRTSENHSQLNGHSEVTCEEENISRESEDFQFKKQPKRLFDENSTFPVPVLLILSAFDEAGVERQAQAHRLYVQEHAKSRTMKFLGDYSYTLTSYRPRLPWSSFCVLEHPTQFQSLPKILSKPTRGLEDSKLGLVFTGQGAQWSGMGRELLSDHTFLSSVRRSQSYLAKLGCTLPLLDLVARKPEKASLHDAQSSQILTTVVQIGLIDLLYWLDLKPAVVVGHSSGEITAAYAAGYISAKSALQICYYRGTLGDKLEKTSPENCGMAAIGLSKDQVGMEIEEARNAGVLPKDALLTISCINSPSNTTIQDRSGLSSY